MSIVRKVLKLMITLALGVMFCGPSMPAYASTHEICGFLRHWYSFNRTDDSTGSYQTGAKGNRNVVAGMRIELWDMDGMCEDHALYCYEGDDDLLGAQYTVKVDNSFSFCFTGVGNLEDVYLRTRYESYYGEIRDEFGNKPSRNTRARIDFGTGKGTRLIWNWNITCWDDSKNDVGGHCDDPGESADIAAFFSEEEAYANILRMIEDAHDRTAGWTINGSSLRMTAYYPDAPESNCSNYGGLSLNQDEFCTKLAHSNHVWAHEIGHNLHKRALDINGSVTDGSCSSNYGWNSYEYDKCSTAEGWADFVSGAIHYAPYWSSSTPNYNGEQLEGLDCVSLNMNPHRRIGNVARFFWDLYDSTYSGPTEDDWWDDDTSHSFLTLMNTWGEFPSGIGDRKASESGVYGRNVYDFANWEPSAEYLIYHNCLGGQQQ